MKRKRFTKEFKLEALRLLEQDDKPGAIPTPGAKPDIPLPLREQQADRRVGLIPSIKQSRYRRGPTCRQPSGCYRSCMAIQVSKYLLNDHWVFDAGEYLDETGAFAANTGLLEGLLMAGSSPLHHWKLHQVNGCFLSNCGQPPNKMKTDN